MSEQIPYEERIAKRRERMKQAADALRSGIETPAHDGTPALKTVLLLKGIAKAMLVMIEDEIEGR